MIYAVEYLNIHTGQVRITTGRPEGSIWPVVCQAKTDGIASLVKIQEHYVSYWDHAKGAARGSDLNAYEMGDRHYDVFRYDRESGKATVQVTRKGLKREKVVDVPNDVQDIGSVFVFLRQKPLNIGDHIEVPIFTGHQIFTLVADVLGKEVLETKAGKFSTLKVRVATGFRGKFEAKRDSFMWFSDDPRHVPVKISSDFAVGSVVVTLEKYKPGTEIAQK